MAAHNPRQRLASISLCTSTVAAQAWTPILDPCFTIFPTHAAARGNFYQGAADNFSLFRWAAGFSGTLPGINGTVKFDKANLMYFGHSQGGTTGPIFAPYQPGLKGAIFSGCGGSLVFGLLGKNCRTMRRLG